MTTISGNHANAHAIQHDNRPARSTEFSSADHLPEKPSEEKVEEQPPGSPVQTFRERYRPQTAEEKRLDRRINLKFDMVMVVLVGFGFMFSGIDKTNIGNAATVNFVKDARLHANDIGNATSLFAVTFVILQPFCVMAARLVGPRWWLGTMLVLWGGVAMAHAGINNRATLIGLRLLLGALEAGWYPASMYYISGFYPRIYIGSRIAITTLLFTSGSAFAGLIAYGILRNLGIENAISGSLHNWQYLFIFEGAITVGLGFLSLCMLPASPSNAWCKRRRSFESDQTDLSVIGLNKEERVHAATRLQIDLGPSAELDKHGLLHTSRTVTKKDWVSGLTDWPKMFMDICNIFIVLPVNAFGVFLPLILQGMGYAGVQANLMSVPPFLVGSVVAWFVIILSDKIQIRGPLMVLGNFIALIGLIVMIVSDVPKVRYGFTILCMIGAFIPAPIGVAWLVVNTPSASKRSVILGINGWANIASVIAGQLFQAKYKPSCK